MLYTRSLKIKIQPTTTASKQNKPFEPGLIKPEKGSSEDIVIVEK